MAGKRILKARGLWEEVIVEPITERILVVEELSELSSDTEVRTMCGTWNFVWITSMARVRLAMSVILTSERSLLGKGGGRVSAYKFFLCDQT